ncbi:hypothetical protein L1987_63500 [Smallanthus sonchifolius]|uniref:Uncharacterized protein n=1 Tax=Smallanthus sonchifolius TaxID=185202 RepID=A0ACB9CDG0_9ASTR|nr:hypothetical protein L1987_63500 [Smallanthus sonchifolius]
MPVRVTQATTSAGRRGGRRGGGYTGGRSDGCGRIPARQEYIEEESVHTEPENRVHGTERTHVEEQQFSFEPEVKASWLENLLK